MLLLEPTEPIQPVLCWVVKDKELCMKYPLYVIANIEGKEDSVELKVQEYVDSVDVPNLQDAVDYVMSHKPAGVTRVDGYCIQPILNDILNPQEVL